MKRVLALAAAAGLTILMSAAPVAAQTAPPAGGCAFQNGFATIDSMVPAIVGSCLANAHSANATGDTMQETSNGLLTWTKATDVTEFTDGHSTWVLSGYGLILRDAGTAYSWEGATSQVAGVAINAQGQPVDPLTSQVLPKDAHLAF